MFLFVQTVAAMPALPAKHTCRAGSSPTADHYRRQSCWPLLPPTHPCHSAPTMALSQTGEQAGFRWLLHSAGSKPCVSTLASSAGWGRGHMRLVVGTWAQTWFAQHGVEAVCPHVRPTSPRAAHLLYRTCIDARGQECHRKQEFARNFACKASSCTQRMLHRVCATRGGTAVAPCCQECAVCVALTAARHHSTSMCMHAQPSGTSVPPP